MQERRCGCLCTGLVGLPPFDQHGGSSLDGTADRDLEAQRIEPCRHKRLGVGEQSVNSQWTVSAQSVRSQWRRSEQSVNSQ